MQSPGRLLEAKGHMNKPIPHRNERDYKTEIIWHGRKLFEKLIGTSPITARGGRRLRPVAALKVADGGVARGGEGAAKLGITESACKNQSVMVSVQYGPFNTYIPIRSTTIGKSRVAKDPITMHTSWRSNSDIASVTRASLVALSSSIQERSFYTTLESWVGLSEHDVVETFGPFVISGQTVLQFQ
ncbi:F-box and associated domain-containing protein [Dorcoceras hygrometricum]|uniref:F-box and associated domain-containing protein n=1 Tax=Dorcoceras hygrometricum TaxID=472368 RepID=A0A2Z7CCA5_9LAMI|nr:F-box and associated domain-containing protein [Dorcoceras hygrometricum]